MLLIGIVGRSQSGKSTVASMLTASHIVRQDGAWRALRATQAPLLGYSVELALADPMKVFLQELYGFSDEQLWGDPAARSAPDERYPRRAHELDQNSPLTNLRCKHCGVSPPNWGLAACVLRALSPREALQQLGTEWARAMWPATWITRALRDAKEIGAGVRVTQPAGRANFTLTRADAVVFSDLRYVDEARAVRDAGGAVWLLRRKAADERASMHASEVEQGSARMADVASHIIDNEGTLDDLRAEVLRALDAAPLAR